MTSRISPDVAEQVEILYVKVAPELHGYACSLPQVGPHMAQDLVQQAFQDAALAWRSLAVRDFEGRRRWLYTVVKNKAIDEWRKSSRTVPMPALGAETRPDSDPSDGALNAALLSKCWAAIEAMPPIRQKVAFLRWNEEWSNAEIAAWLDIAPATVRGHVKAARDELKYRLGPDIHVIEDDDGLGWTGEGAAS